MEQLLDPTLPWPHVILRGDYADPSILRDGGDYYMTHSPEDYIPGFLIWHSTDLMHWEPVCRAMTKYVGSAWAPDLLKYADKYYIYFPAEGVNWVIWADTIRGPWSDPIELNVDGIDPGHAVGEDGKRYLLLSAGNMIPLSDDGLSVIGEKQTVYAGWDYPSDWKTEGKFLESPKIIHKGDYYYMVSAEGGTAGPPTSHMAVAARSQSIHGPWENSPYNPIVHTYSAEEPWWSKGHGTLIDDVNGNWWIVYHAYEPGYYTLGRVTLIDPIEWTDDGWFRVAEKAPDLPEGKPVADGMKLSDDFSGKELGLQWTTWRSYDPNDIVVGNGNLYLRGKGTGPKDARLLLTTASDTSYETEVEVTLDQAGLGGLILFYSEKAFAGISSDGHQFTVYKNADQFAHQTNTFGNHFFLKIINRQNTCDLLASGDGQSWVTIQSGVDVSQMHHNEYGGFFALRPGLMAAGNAGVQFNDFVHTKIDDHAPLKP
jgi:beta-xylosidase